MLSLSSVSSRTAIPLCFVCLSNSGTPPPSFTTRCSPPMWKETLGAKLTQIKIGDFCEHAGEQWNQVTLIASDSLGRKWGFGGLHQSARKPRNSIIFPRTFLEIFSCTLQINVYTNDGPAHTVYLTPKGSFDLPCLWELVLGWAKLLCDRDRLLELKEVRKLIATPCTQTEKSLPFSSEY